MQQSTHYYVLRLGEQTNQLYECFRSTLIDVHNQGFPVEAPTAPGPVDEQGDESRLRDLMRAVDRRFAHYYQQDPLKLIVVGEKRVQSGFESVTAHRDVIMGCVEGDHEETSLYDLGKIVWPIVKDSMSGVNDMVLHDLETAEKAKRLVCGLEAVARYSDVEVGGRLLVEDHYHVRGTMERVDQTFFVSQDVDVRATTDDVVDTIIDRVLEMGGSVVFMANGSLKRQERIALILAGTETT